jgi:hypothetical protein
LQDLLQKVRAGASPAQPGQKNLPKKHTKAKYIVQNNWAIALGRNTFNGCVHF